MEPFNPESFNEDHALERDRGVPEWTMAGGKAGERRSAVRRHLIKRFASWLDSVLDSEQPPEGVAAEILAELEGTVDPEDVAVLDGSCDTQALWAALTSVFQEVKLQGRAFKDLSEKAAPLEDLGARMQGLLDAHPETLDAIQRLAEDARDARRQSVREIAAEAERRGRKELLEVFLDLRDRLVRGQRGLAEGALSQAPEPPEPSDAPQSRARGGRGWLARLFRREGATLSELQPEPRPERHADALAALAKGYSLTLDRLEETLERLEVSEIECVGELFDPHVMSAAEVKETAEVPEGTVLGVLRAGYRWKGEVLRVARVRVARRPDAGDDATEATTDDAEEMS